MYRKILSLTKFTFNRRGLGAGKMAQWLKALAAKPEDLSSILETEERENSLPEVVLWLP